MKFWKAIIIWLLLVSSSVVISVAALLLLWREQERLEQLQMETLQQRAESVASDISLLLDEVKLGLEQGLQQMPKDSTQAQLERWVEANPYAQAAFIVNDNQVMAETQEGIAGQFVAITPEQIKAADEEQLPPIAKVQEELQLNQITTQRQKIRSEQQTANVALGYSVSVSQSVGTEKATPSSVSLGTSKAAVKDSFADSVGSVHAFIANEPLAKSQQMPSLSEIAELAPPQEPPPLNVSWRWQKDDDWQLVGIGKFEGVTVAKGALVKTASFHNDVRTLLQETERSAVSFSLMDGTATVFEQSSSRSYGETFSTSLSLDAVHPGWTLTARAPAGALVFGLRLFTLGGLVIALLGGAILLAGTLLLWQTWLGMREARVRSNFVSNVSHELKTPLTTIRMYADMLRTGRLTEETKRSHYLNTIVSESERLNRLVMNVLDLSRMENGGRSYTFAPTDIGDLIQSVADDQQAAASNAGMQIDVNLPSDTVTVNADADALRQVLLNLTDNAIKYAAQGKSLKFELRTENRQACITVSDQGDGIPDAMRKKIFKPFHQSSKRLTDTSTGCGLGLSISRSIIRAHGGDLILQTSKTGAVFKIQLQRSSNE